MSLKPQHKFRCYCGSKEGCFGIRQNYLTTKATNFSNSSTLTRLGAKKESNQKFIKIKKSTRDSTVTASNKHGLGHSQGINNSCFSRRNSANSLCSEFSSGTSKIHFASDSSGGREGRRRASVDSFTSTITSQPTDTSSTIWSKRSEQESDGYTERRRCYEQSKIFFQIDPELERAQNRACAGVGFIEKLNKVQTKLLSEIPTNDVIAALQRFRLDNPDDCFNTYRQNELKMERRMSECSSIGSSSSQRIIIPTEESGNECCCGCKCCAQKDIKGQNSTKQLPKKLVEDVGKNINNDKKFQPLRPVAKSLALRFQS